MLEEVLPELKGGVVGGTAIFKEMVMGISDITSRPG